jgi:hypothetical protein
MPQASCQVQSDPDRDGIQSCIRIGEASQWLALRTARSSKTYHPNAECNSGLTSYRGVMPQAGCQVLSRPDPDRYGSEAHVGTGEQAGDWLYRQHVARRATIGEKPYSVRR